MENGAGFELGDGGWNWGWMCLGLWKGWKWDWFGRHLNIGVVDGYRVEVGAEVGKGWLG